MKKIIVLGTDPGIANTGLAMAQLSANSYQLIDAQLVKTPPSDDTGKRLQMIHEAITLLLDKHAPQAIAIEKVYHNKNVNSSISTGKVIGLCEITAYNYDLAVHLFTPQQIKAASGFGGSANKNEMIKVANRIFRTKITSHNTADAALCALCCCLQARTEYL